MLRLKIEMEIIVHGHHDQIVGTDQIPVWREVILYANYTWNVTEYQLIVLESVWLDCWSKPNIGICFCWPVIEIVESLSK